MDNGEPEHQSDSAGPSATAKEGHLSTSRALDAVLRRVHTQLNSTFSPSVCLQLAVAAGMRPSMQEDVIGFLLSHAQSKLLATVCESVQIRPQEWSALFGCGVPTGPTSREMKAFVDSQAFRDEIQVLRRVFELTLCESEQATLFERPFHQIALYVSIHLIDHENAVTQSFGTIIRADQRKLDDFIDTMDDETGVNTLTFCEALRLACDVVSARHTRHACE